LRDIENVKQRSAEIGLMLRRLSGCQRCAEITRARYGDESKAGIAQSRAAKQQTLIAAAHGAMEQENRRPFARDCTLDTAQARFDHRRVWLRPFFLHRHYDALLVAELIAEDHAAVRRPAKCRIKASASSEWRVNHISIYYQS
jgi:hypothetical protein